MLLKKDHLWVQDHLRFDFSHMKPINESEISKIENYVNKMVDTKSDVRTRLMTPKEAVDNGAIALFGEKYGEEVRVLSMGKEENVYFSTELCGGTHVKNTSEIGKFKIINQSSIAAGIRRVEALRSTQLSKFLHNKEKEKSIEDKRLTESIEKIKQQILSSGGKSEINNNETLNEALKRLTKQYEKLLIVSVLKNKEKNKIKEETVNNIKIRFQIIHDLPTKELRSVIDQGKKELKEGIIIAYATHSDKLGLAIGITEKLTEKFSAIDLVKIGSSILGGKGGGGRKDFAQAGGEKQEKIEKSYKEIVKKIS